MLGILRARSRFRRAPRAFGLDIGSTAVSVVQLHPRDGALAVSRCASVPIAAGSVAEGAIRDTGAATAAVREAAAAAGIRGAAAVVGVCGRELIMKKLQLPEMPARELAGAVRIQAEQEIPFAIDDVFLDYQITARQNRLIDLTLVAAKKSKVMEYHAVVTAAGFTTAVVDVDGFALGNQYALTAVPTSERVVVVDVGATLTKVAVVSGAFTDFVRDVPLGGGRHTQAIAARLGVPLEAAEAIKLGLAPSPHAGAVAEACDAVSRDLGREVQRALDYRMGSDTTAAPVARVALVGGGALMAGLDATLASILGLPVVLANPFEGLAIAAGCAKTVARAGPRLALSLGLSLRRHGDAAKP